jgi:phospholipase C
MAVIQHVFVLMLENRSYDSIFGWSRLAGTTPTGEAATANGLPATPIVNFGSSGDSLSVWERCAVCTWL